MAFDEVDIHSGKCRRLRLIDELWWSSTLGHLLIAFVAYEICVRVCFWAREVVAECCRLFVSDVFIWQIRWSLVGSRYRFSSIFSCLLHCLYSFDIESVKKSVIFFFFLQFVKHCFLKMTINCWILKYHRSQFSSSSFVVNTDEVFSCFVLFCFCLFIQLSFFFFATLLCTH